MSETIQNWLEDLLQQQQAVAGTVHLHRPERDGLELAAAVNIPEAVQKVVRWVPNGKGMAGLALERGQPVQTCNLKESSSADVQPGAKAVDARGAVALPVHDRDGGVRAVIGVAYAEERELVADELIRLESATTTLPRA